MVKPHIESTVFVFIVQCSYPSIAGYGNLDKNPSPPVFGYGSEHVKFSAIDVFIHAVQCTNLEGVYSDILAQFAGNEEAL